MNFNSISLLGITFFFVLFLFQGQAFGQNIEENIEENVFPDWVRQGTEIWVSGEISDSEFLALIESVLEKSILPKELESKKILKHTAKTVINEFPELYEKSTFEIIPHWVKERAQWWVEGKINDIDLLKITKQAKWRLLSTEYEFEEKEGVVDSVKFIFTDITRVYEPVFYKFKVPSLTMQISEFNNKNDLDNYWNSFEDRTKEKIFDSSYLIGTPNENSECIFNYNSKGAVTSCMYDNLIVQVMMFDQHGEHFDYNVDNLILDKTEPTSRLSGEILKKISYSKNDRINSSLHQVLQNKNLDTSFNQDKSVPKSTELEKSVSQGVQNFSCVRDDFGLVTISGQYYNDDIKRHSWYISRMNHFFYIKNPIEKISNG